MSPCYPTHRYLEEGLSRAGFSGFVAVLSVGRWSGRYPFLGISHRCVVTGRRCQPYTLCYSARPAQQYPAATPFGRGLLGDIVLVKKTFGFEKLPSISSFFSTATPWHMCHSPTSNRNHTSHTHCSGTQALSTSILSRPYAVKLGAAEEPPIN